MELTAVPVSRFSGQEASRPPKKAKGQKENEKIIYTCGFWRSVASFSLAVSIVSINPEANSSRLIPKISFNTMANRMYSDQVRPT